jgi:hypothetical protein
MTESIATTTEIKQIMNTVSLEDRRVSNFLFSSVLRVNGEKMLLWDVLGLHERM